MSTHTQLEPVNTIFYNFTTTDCTIVNQCHKDVSHLHVQSDEVGIENTSDRL